MAQTEPDRFERLVARPTLRWSASGPPCSRSGWCRMSTPRAPEPRPVRHNRGTPAEVRTLLLRSAHTCVVSEIGVREAATWLAVSPQRVRAMIASGALPARQVSGVWLIDASAPWRVAGLSRPLTPRMAQALILRLSGEEAVGIPANQRSRLRAYARRLSEHAQPAQLLASWLTRRSKGRRLGYLAHHADLPALAADPRLIPTGVSDPRSNIAASGELEAWVCQDDLPGLERDHMLTTSGRPNVHLRVSPAQLPRPVPLGVLLAALADWPGSREQESVRRLLADAQPVAPDPERR